MAAATMAAAAAMSSGRLNSAGLWLIAVLAGHEEHSRGQVGGEDGAVVQGSAGGVGRGMPGWAGPAEAVAEAWIEWQGRQVFEAVYLVSRPRFCPMDERRLRIELSRRREYRWRANGNPA
jgi:hypothetical protein